MPEKNLFELLQWSLTLIFGGLSSYSIKSHFDNRDRNLKIENRLTTIEQKPHLTEGQVKEMIENSKREMAAFVKNLKENQEKSNQAAEKLTATVAELTIVTAVLKEKIK